VTKFAPLIQMPHSPLPSTWRTEHPQLILNNLSTEVSHRG
jgi:hypothetical protein